MGGSENSQLETWYITANKWALKNDAIIPVAGNAFWKLKEGSFDYFQWEVADIQYD